MDAFFLTDFLTRQFEAFVVEPLGLDRHPELRDMYFGNYRRLIYLAQTEDAELQKIALAEPNVQTHLAGKTPRKVVIVKGKLVSVVV